jgi:hypothetical protein
MSVDITRLAMHFLHAVALLAAMPIAAVASDAGPEAVVVRFDALLNACAFARAAALCASPASVIDEFPPYAWSGASACNDWARDLRAAIGAYQAKNYRITLDGQPFVDKAGDRAYVVYRATLTYVISGKVTTERNAKWAFVLRQLGDDWTITSWAWSGGA